jgi:phage FluMu protein Com
MIRGGGVAYGGCDRVGLVYLEDKCRRCNFCNQMDKTSNKVIRDSWSVKRLNRGVHPLVSPTAGRKSMAFESDVQDRKTFRGFLLVLATSPMN